MFSYFPFQFEIKQSAILLPWKLFLSNESRSFCARLFLFRFINQNRNTAQKECALKKGWPGMAEFEKTWAKTFSGLFFLGKWNFGEKVLDDFFQSKSQSVGCLPTKSVLNTCGSSGADNFKIIDISILTETYSGLWPCLVCVILFHFFLARLLGWSATLWCVI